MALLRPDVMPKGDLALHVAWQRLKKAASRPNADEFLRMAERWTPLRAVAARLLWHFYLSERKFQPKPLKMRTKENFDAVKRG
jgi:DNA-3-methyladenine glycosylase II